MTQRVASKDVVVALPASGSHVRVPVTGRVFFMTEADGPVIIGIDDRDRDTKVNEGEVRVPGDFRSLTIESVGAAQTIRFRIDPDPDETSASKQVNISTVTADLAQPGAVAHDSDLAALAAGANILAVDGATAQRDFTIVAPIEYDDATPFDGYIMVSDSGVGPGNGIPLRAGDSYSGRAKSDLYVYNGGSKAATVYRLVREVG